MGSNRRFLEPTSTESVVLGPAALALPGSLLEMQSRAPPQTFWIRILFLQDPQVIACVH